MANRSASVGSESFVPILLILRFGSESASNALACFLRFFIAISAIQSASTVDIGSLTMGRVDCFAIYNGQDVVRPGKPYSICRNSTASPAPYCCSEGDACLIDSICHSTQPAANTTGCYIGGCTYETYSSSIYSQQGSIHALPNHLSREPSHVCG